MTPGDIIPDVKRIIQDNPLMRTADAHIAATLLEFVNLTLQRIVSFRPDEFAYIDTALATTQDSVFQSLPATGVRIMEIFSVTGGNVVQEVDRDTLDRVYPGWQAEASGTPVNWCRHPRNPRRYFLYPKPTSGITLNAEYVKAPSTLALGDTITLLPDSFRPIIIDGTAYQAEAVFNGTNSDRAKLFFDSFMSGLRASAGTRVNTDNEAAGVGSNSDR